MPVEVVSHRGFDTREAFDTKMVEVLRAHEVEWVVLAGFMRLVTPVFLEAFHQRVVNIHPALLPAFPGVNAQQQAFDAGVKVTGCTVHVATEEVDAGPILAQRAVEVLPGDTEASLHERIKAVERPLYLETIRRILEEGVT